MSRKPILHPVYADFEKAIHSAASFIWPESDIKGCRFHLGQSW
jgi:hypothetical protein